jgi:succinate dehydrogenase / fumarate reductase, cytochrome b subunit
MASCARKCAFSRGFEVVVDNAPISFFARHEFLLRRLHSLSGLVPVGAYMVVHLLTNAAVWDGAASYQRLVYQIHSLGIILPVVEWTFIFIPLLFHGIYGLVLVRESQPNTSNYPNSSNVRYTLQRATGLIAFLFIGWHVFHMHGWIHTEAWREFVHPWGAQFAPYNATSTGVAAMQQSLLVSLLYLVGILACVFHLANGVWTMGITWGWWTTAQAQKRANWIAVGFGVITLALGLGAWSGFAFKYNASDPAEMDQVRKTEESMLQQRIDGGELDAEEAEHKRARQVTETARRPADAAHPAARPE